MGHGAEIVHDDEFVEIEGLVERGARKPPGPVRETDFVVIYGPSHGKRSEPRSLSAGGSERLFEKRREILHVVILEGSKIVQQTIRAAKGDAGVCASNVGNQISRPRGQEYASLHRQQLGS
jgi:hypothetical protein